jgi:hypothetical protein
MYRDSSHPFQSTTAVAEFLEDPRNFQILAEAGNRIVASMAMTLNAWNDSYELGRAVTVPDFRRNGLAGFLMQQVVDWVAAERLGEVTFGYPRVRRIAELCSTLDPKIVPVGHDGGRNVANGSRETHLIVCGIPQHSHFTHVAPMIEGLLSWPFLREQIYRPLGLSGMPGSYPPQCFVGAPPSSPIVHSAWVFDHPHGNPSGALEVIGRQDDALSPEEVSRELEEILSAFVGVQHVTATILADKIALFRALVQHGFELCAYLPAWVRYGSFRCDCIQLIRRQYAGLPSSQDFPDLLGELEAAFQSSPLFRIPDRIHRFAACV